MNRSDDRILVTHVGSLPRPKELLELLIAREQGGEYDPQQLDDLQARGVSDVVRRQLDLGIDVVNDGELGKTSFLSCVNIRLGGFVAGAPVSGSFWRRSRSTRRSRRTATGQHRRVPAASPPHSV